jgi:2-polyprenyl-3-methyl-5-hydroxy-6-metoxy-1,4-benzoquinol methylase
LRSVTHHQGSTRASAAFWDERYRSSGSLWSGEPNPQLIADVAELPPGAALDAGCGEGADAIWLAERGWRVTAVDFSTVALERGASHARASGLDAHIEWVRADLLAWVPAVASYDLVSAQFVHLPADSRAAVHERLAAAVSPGGTLLLVEHSPRDLSTTARRPHDAGLFTTAADIAAALDAHEWEIVVSEARPRQAPDPAGDIITVYDEVVRARRRGPRSQ